MKQIEIQSLFTPFGKAVFWTELPLANVKIDRVPGFFFEIRDATY